MKIAQVLYAGSWGEVTPETIEAGLGGRETAMIKLAEAWAGRGHQVTNFVNVEKGKRFDGNEKYFCATGRHFHDGFHEYLPIQLTKGMLGNMPWDAVVAWEMPSIFNDDDIRENAKVKVCEMQVAHFPGKELEAANEHCNYVAALSDWHGEFLTHSGLEMKNGRVVTLPNGVDMRRYPKDRFDAKVESFEVRPNPTFVYSSSPDRGLWHLLKAWPKIRKNFPGSDLMICYGLDKYIDQMKWAHVRQAQMCVEIEELVKQPGVVNCGKIGQSALAHLQMKADVWAYPLDALWPTETGCITAVENAAAGNPLIFTDADCLPSEFGGIGSVLSMPFDEDELANSVTQILQNKSLYQQMQIAGRDFAEQRDWNLIGGQWLDLFAQTTDHS